MRVISISTKGVSSPAVATVKASNGNSYYAICHGEEGRGRWQVRFPLAVREFPFHEKETPSTQDQEFSLVDLRKTDKKNNGMYLLAKGAADNAQLVFWRLSPGYRGGASYTMGGGCGQSDCPR